MFGGGPQGPSPVAAQFEVHVELESRPAMRFLSTRGGAKPATFEEAISTGYAPDGGLYVPEALPRVTHEELQRWRSLDFVSLAEVVLAPFVAEELGGVAKLRQLLESSYKDFSCPEVVPVKRVGGLFVAELFHGPTFCFKDLGQQPLARFLATFAERRGKRQTMLVSTTGDTGPAAMRAVRDSGSPNLDIIVFYPDGQISDMQRRQMTTCAGPRARVATFEGGGDDMDIPLKRLAADKAFATKHGLCGINSYNLGRPVSQMVHSFWTYFRVMDQLGLATGTPLDLVLPAGALGNLASAFMARQMGLPLRRIVAGTNSNDITHKTISSGTFHRSQRMEKTLSDAINIQVPYNMERIFYYLTGEDSSLVRQWMEEMDRTARLTLPPQWLSKMQEVFGSCRVDDSPMCETVRRSLERHDYLADPHTAVALAAAWRTYGELAKEPPTAAPVAVLATASPCKFEHAMCEAVGPEHWATYAGGSSFPAAARDVLAATEQPYGRLRSQGDLGRDQTAWENERGLGGMGVRPLTTLQPETPLSGHIMTFMLTCVTDLALVPPLIVMRRYRRHFEIYVGCMMLVSAFAYNFLDAMNRGDAAEKSWALVIQEEDWHRISNVTSTTYICLLLIHLMCITNPDANIILRYCAATLVLVAQIKDGFWMQETCYTVYVVCLFGLALVGRYVAVAELPVYWTSQNLLRGAVLGAATGVCFYFGLDDDHDEFRFAHGISHLFGGLALTFLWRLVPRPKRKEEDIFSRASLYR